MRPQYTRAKCGACGKKGAYLSQMPMSNFTCFDVQCIYCRAEQTFTSPQVLSYPEWPGDLEKAATMLGQAKREGKA